MTNLKMELDDCVVIENDIDIGQMEDCGMNFICNLYLHNRSNYDIEFLIVKIKLCFVVIYRSNE